MYTYSQNTFMQYSHDLYHVLHKISVIVGTACVSEYIVKKLLMHLFHYYRLLQIRTFLRQ